MSRLDNSIVAAFERLSALAGTPRVEPDDVRSALLAVAENLDEDGESSWARKLAAVLERTGLRAHVLSTSVDELAAATGLGRPVIVRASERGCLVLVTDRRGARLRIEELPGTGEPEARPLARWISAGELTSMVSPSSSVGSPIEWLAVDAALPVRSLESDDAGGHGHPSPWRRLGALLKLESADVWAVIVYAIAVGVLGLTTPVAVQALVNTVAFGTLLQPLLVLSLLLFGGLALSALLRGLSTWVVEIVQQRIFVRFVSDFSHRLPRVRRDALDGRDAGELLNRFFDVFTVQKSVASLMLGGLELVLTVLVGLLVLAFYHPILLALDVLLVVIVLALVLGFGRRGVDTAMIESKEKYAVASWLETIARAPAVFRLGAGPSFAWRGADARARDYLAARKAHFRVVLTQIGATLALQAMASAAVLGVGGWLVVSRQLTLGQLVAAELIVTVVVASLAKTGKYLESAYDLLAGLDKIGYVVDLPVERGGGTAVADEGAAAITLRDVDAGYGEGGEDILAGVSLQIAAGERVAIVGGAGSGKSLLLELFSAMRLPRRGSVRIGDADVRYASLEELRHGIAMVRDVDLVSGTVLDNVTLGRADVSATDAWRVLDAVGLRDAIEAVPGALEAELGADGAPLSRSAAIRLTLARALASRPRVLVIDGALDVLPSDVRSRVLDALFEAGAGFTLVVVSAHPEVLAMADRCLVTMDGGVVETAAQPAPGGAS